MRKVYLTDSEQTMLTSEFYTLGKGIVRIDKFDLAELRGSGDDTRFADVIEECKSLKEQGVQGGHHYRFIRATEHTGMMIWSLQIWGEVANSIAISYADKYALFLTRLDVRFVLDETNSPMDAKSISTKAALTDKAEFNVTAFNVRPSPRKDAARHAGGCGVQLGSHKSDKRTVVYRRGNEKAAIEVALADRALSRILQTALHAAKENGYTEFFHSVLLEAATVAKTMLGSLNMELACDREGLIVRDGRPITYEEMEQVLLF